MSFALVLSRFALALGVLAVALKGLAWRPSAGRSRRRNRLVMALGTFALGLALFAFFYGLVAACDRL